MSEYGLFGGWDGIDGGREFTDEEKDRLMFGKPDVKDMARIFAEREPDVKAYAPPMLAPPVRAPAMGAPAPPAVPPAEHWPAAPVVRPPDRVPARHWPAVDVPRPPALVPPAAVAPAIARPDDALARRYIGEKFDELREENKKVQDQLAEYRKEKVEARDRWLVEPRDRWLIVERDDDSLYNRLYSWGLGLMPTYYSYIQRKRIEDALKRLIKAEILLNTPEYELQRLIRTTIETTPTDATAAQPVKKKKSKRSKRTKSKRSPKKKTTRKPRKKA